MEELLSQYAAVIALAKSLSSQSTRDSERYFTNNLTNWISHEAQFCSEYEKITRYKGLVTFKI